MRGLTDVEGLIEDGLLGRLECGDERPRDVLDVDDRPPRRAVGLEEDAAIGDSPGDKIVENDIETQSRRDAVGGGGAQEGRTEAISGELRDVPLGAHLRNAIGGQRLQLAGLIDHVVTSKPVVAARGGEQEPFDACLLAEFSDPHAGEMIDVVRQIRD